MGLKEFMGPAVHVMKKEITEIVKTGMIRFLVAAPIIQAVIFGYVATTDIKNVPTLICDEDDSRDSRELAGKFMNNSYFTVTRVIHNPSEIEKDIGENRSKVCVRIPNGFRDDIKTGRKAQVQLIGDGTDSNSAVLTMTRAQLMVIQFSNDKFRAKIEAVKKNIGRLPQLSMRERVWYNPELKSSHVMVPGVMGLILAIVTLVVMSISVVREKEAGNLEQMVVTPIRPSQIIAGKIIPYVVIGLVDITLVVITCGIICKAP
ncbi:MAG TPA: ABC transporter permease, partial [Candidatus Goldiibacteriota bacterium]|nr:ABC transporter permease [Candidatus Goldiibacteriota bacterium]